MKKTIAILLALLMILGLFAGCGSRDSGSGSSGSAAELEAGWYSLTDDDDELVGYLCSTGKKVTAYDADGEELMEEAKFKYDEDEEAFVIDGTNAFTLTVSKKTVTITIPKKSPLGFGKGEYTLTEVDEDEVGGGTAGPADELPKGWYALKDGKETMGYLYSTGKKVAAYDANGEELMGETKFSYDEEEEAFLIDDTPAFSLEKTKDGYTVTIPKKSPLPFDKGDYSAVTVEESEVGSAAGGPGKPDVEAGDPPAGPEPAVEQAPASLAGTWTGSFDFGEVITASVTDSASLTEIESYANAPLSFEGYDLTAAVTMVINEDLTAALTVDPQSVQKVMDNAFDGTLAWMLPAMDSYIAAMCKESGISVADFYSLVAMQYGTAVNTIEDLLPLMGVDLEEYREEIMSQYDLSSLSEAGLILLGDDAVSGVYVPDTGTPMNLTIDADHSVITLETDFEGMRVTIRLSR